MQKIIPHLWYDKEAREAAELYISTFPNAGIKNTVMLHNTPSGDSEIVSFELLGYEFMAISAGPAFKLNPSVSFQVTCSSKDQVDAYWQKLSPGGQVLMELGAYPFSERFGWLNDKYGLSWQFLYTGVADIQEQITPFIMFVGDNVGKAEEAINFWTSVFPGSSINNFMRYGKGEEPDTEGTIKLASFSLAGQEFRALDSAHDHQFAFNEAISFLVNCDTQEEIDFYWNKLSADPEAEVCGWLKDKYGFSWQISPAAMGRMMSGNDPEKIDRLTQALLVMKKLDLRQLEDAYEGRI